MLYYEINKLKNSEQEKTASRRQNETLTEDITPENDNILTRITSSSKFEDQERNILQILVKHGEVVFYFSDEEKLHPVTVGDYILEELERDNLLFYNEVHALLLEEYKQNHRTEGFVAERFFLYHSNSRISLLTADLISEKYTLSKIHSKIKKIDTDAERLLELVPRLVYEFKNSLILDIIKQKLLELKAANDARNNTIMDQIMLEIKQLDEVKKQLSKTLGERIIIKL